MDSPAISGIPTNPAIIRTPYNRDRQERRRPGQQSFDEVLGKRGERGEQSHDGDSVGSDEPVVRRLQRRVTPVRRDPEEGEMHVDVMA